MLRPITVAPMFASDSSTTRVLSLTSPPGIPCMERHAASGNTHSCSRMPPIPSGLSTLCSGPATNPSSDIEIFMRSLDMALPSATIISLVPCRCLHYMAGRTNYMRRCASRLPAHVTESTDPQEGPMHGLADRPQWPAGADVSMWFTVQHVDNYLRADVYGRETAEETRRFLQAVA